MKKLLLALLLLAGCAQAQLWTNQLSSTRAVAWESSPALTTIPTRNTICATLSSGATAAQINAAFTACPNGQVVFLNAGTYSLSGGLKLQANADGVHGTNVTVRGAGPLLTILNFTSPNACMGAAGDVCFINNFAIGGDNAFALPPCGGAGAANCADWTAGYAKGATSITLANVGTNAPQIGQLLILDQANDLTNTAAALIQCDVVGPCSYSGGAFGRVLTGSKTRSGGTYVNANYSQLQVVKITNIAGNVYTIAPGLYANNWRSGQTPGAYWSSTASAGPLVGAGLENLTVDHTNSTGEVSGIEFANCYQCYMKNVRSLDSQRNHVMLIQSSGTVIRDSYFYLMKSPGTTSYGIEPQGASDALIENNIFEKIASPILLSEGSGLIIGYNFSWNNLYSNPNFMQTSTVHDAGNFMNLFEGNYFNGISDDVAHGTSPLTTIFRNWVPGQEPSFPRTSGTIPIEVEPNGRAVNVIGNVLGTVGYHTVYEASPNTSSTGCQTTIYQLGWANPNNCTGTSGTSYTGGNDSSVNTTMMRWGNYDTVNAAVRWDATESTPGAITFVSANTTNGVHALPRSYYYSSQPAWWGSAYGTVPWPPIGPDVSGGQGPAGHAYENPAFLCYANGSFTSSILNFDANVCYPPSGGGLVAQTANNTSACSANTVPDAGCNAGFAGLNGNPAHTGAQTIVVDPATSHVSTLPFSTLMYAGATTKYLCEYQPWFLNVPTYNGHINNAMNENNATAVAAQGDDMIRRGCNINFIDWYGTDATQAFNLTTANLVVTDVEARAGHPLQFGILEDQGSIKATTCPLDGAGVSQGTRDTNCTNALNSDMDYIHTNYAGKATYWLDGVNPVVGFFIDESLFVNPVPTWTTIWASVKTHTNAYAVPFKFIFRNSTGFSHASSDGAFAWMTAPAWSITNQFCWDSPACNTFSYLDDFYSTGQANPSKITVGYARKGFDAFNASWDTGKVLAQQCGQVWLDSFLKVSSNLYNSLNQLKYLQLVTWNDYEEGTQIETGIDNCYTLAAFLNGNIVSWTLSPSDVTYATTATIHHFTVYYSDGVTLWPILTNLPGSSTSADITGLVPPGNWSIYVQMVGQPSIKNQLVQAFAQTAVLSTTSLAFGNQTLGTTSLNQTFTISNTGSASLTISSIACSGDFACVDACPDILTAQDYCPVNVTFTPSAASARTGTVTVTDNAVSSPQTVSLTGTGTAITHEYCVSTAGDDTHTGLAVAGVCSSAVSWLHAPGMPLCANVCAATTPVAGDILDFRAQTFTAALIGGTWTWTWSGSAGQPITLRTYPPDVLAGGCTTALPCYALITGMYIATGATWTDDPNDPLEPLCTTPTCDLQYINLAPASFVNFEAFFYNGKRRKRAGMTAQNGCSNLNNPTMCVAGANVAAADTACACPAAVAGQAPPNNHCAALSAPCANNGLGNTPWMCFNQFVYQNSDIVPSWHNMTLGDVEHEGIEKWTMSRDRILSCNDTTKVCKQTGPSNATAGDSGCIQRHRYILENVRDLITAGSWVLDRCPEQDDPGHCTGTQTIPSIVNWRLYIGVASGELPHVDPVFFPQIAPNIPLFTATSVSYVNFGQISFQGDNSQPPALGWPDSQAMPLIPTPLQFINSNHLVFEATDRSHIQGWVGPALLGNTNHVLIENGRGLDAGAGGVKIGVRAAVTDTNTSVPSFITVQNEALDHNGRTQATGEAAEGVMNGNGHDIQIWHNDCLGDYSGCFNPGYGLNRGQSGGDFAFFIYNVTTLFNRVQGEGNTGTGDFIALMHDFGGIYHASNWSTLAPTLGKPSLGLPNTYSVHTKWNVVTDQASDYNNTDTHGAACIYLDQGTSSVEVRFNVTARCAQDNFFLNLPSHGLAGNVGAELLEQYNLISNNIAAGCGAQQYTNGRCVNPGGQNQNAYEFSNNLFFINSLNNEKFQANPGKWAAFDFSQLLVVNGGSGFTSEPSVTIPSCSTPPTIAATISYATGKLLGSIIGTPGAGCPATPTVVISGGGGSGAVMTACVSGGILVACNPPAISATRLWNYHGNQYWDLNTSLLTFILCTGPGTCQAPGGMTLYHSIPWGVTEDVGSIQQNPSFLNYAYPTSNFTPSTVGNGYIDWDHSKAGRLNAVLSVPTVPNLFPLTTINANNDYLGGVNPPTNLTVTVGGVGDGGVQK